MNTILKLARSRLPEKQKTQQRKLEQFSQSTGMDFWKYSVQSTLNVTENDRIVTSLMKQIPRHFRETVQH